MMAPGTKRKTALARRIGLAAGSLLFALLLAESAVRLLPHLGVVNAMGTVMRPDPILDHSLRPGAVGRMRSREYNVAYRINSYGLRDDEPTEGGILLLGDSYMEGYGVERGEVLADKLESLGWSVTNAGTKSYSPLLEYLFLRHRGLALRPDTVLLFFDLSDPANDEYYTRRLVLDDSGLPWRMAPRRTKIPLPPRALIDRSALLSYLEHMALKYFPESDMDVGYAGISLDLDPLFPGRDTLSDTNYLRGWDYSFRYLALIRDLLRERGVAFAVIAYPYGHQVSADAWEEGRKGHGFPEGVSSDRPFRVLERWARENDIPFFSLDHAFRSHPKPGPLYFDWDGHWTAAGHDFAARKVDEWMRSNEERVMSNE